MWWCGVDAGVFRETSHVLVDKFMVSVSLVVCGDVEVNRFAGDALERCLSNTKMMMGENLLVDSISLRIYAFEFNKTTEC